MSKSWIDVYSLHPIITCPHIVFVFRLSWTCHQLKYFVAKMVGFENRIARIHKAVFEKRKRRKPPFAVQKPIIDHTLYVYFVLIWLHL